LPIEKQIPPLHFRKYQFNTTPGKHVYFSPIERKEEKKERKRENRKKNLANPPKYSSLSIFLYLLGICNPGPENDTHWKTPA